LTLPPDQPEQAPPKRKQKQTGRGGGFLALRHRGRLATAWRGSSRIAARQEPGRIVIGLAKAAARIMETFNRALKEALQPHIHPLLRALERAQQEQEAAARQAQAFADELRQIDQYWEEQRRRRQDECASTMLRAGDAGDRALRHADSFANAANAATAPEIPDWLREFFEAEPAGNNLLDPANPARDLVLGVNDDMTSDAGHDITGPSLDFG
jgi:hypothetical protein